MPDHTEHTGTRARRRPPWACPGWRRSRHRPRGGCSDAAVRTVIHSDLTRRGPGGRHQRRAARILAAYHHDLAERAHRARVELTMAGWHLGVVPYGYRPHPDALGAVSTRRRGRRRLVPDPRTAAVVGLIYRWRTTERAGHTAIAHRLNTDPHRYPPPGARSWTADAVRRILANPRYTGRQTLPHPQRPSGLPTRLRVSEPAHPPLIDHHSFWLAQQLSARPVHWPLGHPHPTLVEPVTDSVHQGTDPHGPDTGDGGHGSDPDHDDHSRQARGEPPETRGHDRLHHGQGDGLRPRGTHPQEEQ